MPRPERVGKPCQNCSIGQSSPDSALPYQLYQHRPGNFDDKRMIRIKSKILHWTQTSFASLTFFGFKCLNSSSNEATILAFSTGYPDPVRKIRLISNYNELRGFWSIKTMVYMGTGQIWKWTTWNLNWHQYEPQLLKQGGEEVHQQCLTRIGLVGIYEFDDYEIGRFELKNRKSVRQPFFRFLCQNCSITQPHVS